MRILLVEDEPRAAPYQAAITEYDAIILDVMLPIQDGLSVCRAIRQEGSAGSCPPSSTGRERPWRRSPFCCWPRR